MERTCKKCGDTKPIEEFYKSGTHVCKLCSHIKDKIWRTENSELKKQRDRDYRKKYRDKLIIYSRENYKKNKEIILAKQKIYYNNHKEEHFRRCKEYNKLHKEEQSQYKKEYGKSCKNRNAVRERYKLNIEKNRSKDKNDTIMMTNNYIIQLLTQITGTQAQIIKQYPELIENYRQQIKVKRLLKQKKDENTKTS